MRIYTQNATILKNTKDQVLFFIIKNTWSNVVEERCATS